MKHTKFKKGKCPNNAVHLPKIVDNLKILPKIKSSAYNHAQYNGQDKKNSCVMSSHFFIFYRLIIRNKIIYNLYL